MHELGDSDTTNCIVNCLVLITATARACVRACVCACAVIADKPTLSCYLVLIPINCLLLVVVVSSYSPFPVLDQLSFVYV